MELNYVTCQQQDNKIINYCSLTKICCLLGVETVKHSTL